MKILRRMITFTLLLSTVFFLISVKSNADELWIKTSLYSYHFLVTDWDYNERNTLIGLEYVDDKNYLYGVSYFNNSFNDTSFEVHVGKRWHFRNSGWFTNAYMTVATGYKKQYIDYEKNRTVTLKTVVGPFNILPVVSLGYNYKAFSLVNNIIGNVYMLNVEMKLK